VKCAPIARQPVFEKSVDHSLFWRRRVTISKCDGRSSLALMRSAPTPNNASLTVRVTRDDIWTRGSLMDHTTTLQISVHALNTGAGR